MHSGRQVRPFFRTQLKGGDAYWLHVYRSSRGHDEI